MSQDTQVLTDAAELRKPQRRRQRASIFLDSFTSGLDELPRRTQGSTAEVLRAMEAMPRKRFSVFEATANDTIARTMTRICQQGYIETGGDKDAYPWTTYTLTDKGHAAIRALAGIGKGGGA